MDKTTTAQETYRPVGRLVLRRIGDEQLLVPVSGPLARETRVFPVNPTGAVIWEALLAGRTVEEAAAAVVGAFQVDAQQAEADCAAFVKRLLAEGLLESAS